MCVFFTCRFDFILIDLNVSCFFNVIIRSSLYVQVLGQQQLQEVRSYLGLPSQFGQIAIRFGEFGFGRNFVVLVRLSRLALADVSTINTLSLTSACQDLHTCYPS
jgi:hypothetical protein